MQQSSTRFENLVAYVAEKSTIREISSAYKVSLRTLRFYEEKGLLAPERVGNVRLYSAKDKIRIELIITGKRLGFSLRQISALIASNLSSNKQEPDELIPLLSLDIIKAQHAALVKQRAEIDQAIIDLNASLAHAL